MVKSNLDKIADKIDNKEKILLQELAVLNHCELKILCKYKGIKNYSGKRKNEMMEMLIPPPILEDPWLIKSS